MHVTCDRDMSPCVASSLEYLVHPDKAKSVGRNGASGLSTAARPMGSLVSDASLQQVEGPASPALRTSGLPQLPERGQAAGSPRGPAGAPGRRWGRGQAAGCVGGAGPRPVGQQNRPVLAPEQPWCQEGARCPPSCGRGRPAAPAAAHRPDGSAARAERAGARGWAEPRPCPRLTESCGDGGKAPAGKGQEAGAGPGRMSSGWSCSPEASSFKLCQTLTP